MALPRTPSFRLDGKRAFVPGGSRGIGLGCAVALAEAGAEVVIAARSADQVAESVAQMREAGFAVSGVALDVTNLGAVRAAFGDHGPFGILCNSAGLARHSPSSETTPDGFDAVVSINMKAAYFMAQEAAAQMRTRGGARSSRFPARWAMLAGRSARFIVAPNMPSKDSIRQWRLSGVRTTFALIPFARPSS